MENGKNIAIGVLAIIVVVVGGFFLKPPQVIEVKTFGANPGPDYYERQNFLVGAYISGLFDDNGAIPNATLVGSTATTTAANICDENLVRATASGTISLPSPANFTALGRCLRSTPSEKTFTIFNDSASGGALTITLLASSTLFSQSFATSTAVQSFATTSLIGSSTMRISAIRFTSSSAGAATTSTDWLLYQILGVYSKLSNN